ncbi:BadF/BadG/BcrA/BcrD ATPase family protein, partial [Acidianus sp. RZ1]
MAANLYSDGGIFAPGTGSVGFIRKNGIMKRLGGWGWFFGDEGSASWIARTAITYSTRVKDGIEKDSKLPEEVERFFGLPFRETIAYLSKKQDKRLIASFAARVDALAVEGDDLALKIMEETADYIRKIIGRLSTTGGRVSLIGGVMRSKVIREKLEVLGVPIYFGYQAVIGGIARLTNITFDERDYILKELGKSLRDLPEEKLMKCLFAKREEIF